MSSRLAGISCPDSRPPSPPAPLPRRERGARVEQPLRRAYTLIEILIATTLTLVMMGGVATVFGMIGTTVSSARAGLEMSEALRTTAQRLRTDLAGVVARKSTEGLEQPRRLGSVTEDPNFEGGYLEYVEGPLGSVTAVSSFAMNTDEAVVVPDSSVGDTDDILLFTTRSRGEPFVGRYNGSNAIESQDAEVAWFVRGSTLYRRVLLMRPDLNVPDATGFRRLEIPGSSPPQDMPISGYYNLCDVSARLDRDSSGSLRPVANSLSDLAKRECRYAHHYRAATDDVYPFSVGRWGQLGLPTLGECSHANWIVDGMNPTTVLTGVTPPTPNELDFWSVYPFALWGGIDPEAEAISAYYSPADPRRLGEDVVLRNVIGFDVKAWDPTAWVMHVTATRSGVTEVSAVLPGDPAKVAPADGTNPDVGLYTGYAQAVARNGTNPTDSSATPPITYQYTRVGYGAYVDPGYGSDPVINNAGLSTFAGNNNDATGTGPRSNLTRVYDTWSLHYEYDGIKETGNTDASLPTDAWANGFDDNSLGDPGYGVVDDWYELETQAPYPTPLRGLQVKLRVFEPDSRQIREVTIVHSFVTPLPPSTWR